MVRRAYSKLIGATDQEGKIQGEIQARRIVLVDPITDKKRIVLTGAPILYFYDEKENPVIAFETYGGPALTLESNKKSITMRIREVDYSDGSKGEDLHKAPCGRTLQPSLLD
jgi:hypothetical protein